MSLLLEKSYIHEKCFAHPMILWLKLWQTTIVIIVHCMNVLTNLHSQYLVVYQTQMEPYSTRLRIESWLISISSIIMAITLQTLISYTVTKLVDIVQRYKFKRQRGISRHQWYIHCSSVSATVGAYPLGSCWKSGGCLIG